jgi:predicted metal-binding protein
MFETDPVKVIKLCNNQISDLEKDLEKFGGILAEKIVEIIEKEINSNKIRIKEAELKIRYTDYQ